MAKASQKTKLMGFIGGQTIFGILFLLVLVAAADKSDLRSDWSLSGTYSLHPATERIAKNIQQEATIYGIWPKYPEDNSRDAAFLRNQKTVIEKIKLIAAQSPKLRFEHIDPNIDKPRLKQVEEQIGTSSSRSIHIVASNGRQIKVPYGYYFDRELESSISSALLAVEQKETVQISVLSGHGELGQSDNADDSCRLLLQQFKQSGYELLELNPNTLSTLGRIPQDSVLFIAGPTADLGSDTVKHIDDFLSAGGNALVLADYRCPKDLSALLRKRGMMLGHGICAPDQIFNPDPPVLVPSIICSSDQSIITNDGRYDRISLISTPDYPAIAMEHPVAQRTVKSNRAILMPYNSLSQPIFRQSFAQGLKDFEQHMQAQGTVPYKIDPLITIAGPNVWYTSLNNAKKFPEDLNDKTKVFHLGVSIRYQLAVDAVVKDNESRMVILTSRQCASDSVISQTKYANDLLLLDAIAWLGFREQSSDIPPSSFTELQVSCSESTMTMLGYLMLLVIPMSCLALAMLTWWDRR